MDLRKLLFLLLFLPGMLVMGQRAKDSGDRFYFEYNYKSAIEAYAAQIRRGDSLSHQQRLNLAHSYFQMGGYSQAVRNYLEVYKEDQDLSNTDFNRMLQAMSKNDGVERIKAFLATRQEKLSGELLQNATFNFELLENNLAPQLAYTILESYANSKQGDFGPAFYGDKQILFSSSRPQSEKGTYFPTGEGYLDIYLAELSPTGIAQKPRSFDGTDNSPFHEATPFYDPSQGDLFYVTSNADGDKMVFDENGRNALSIKLTDSEGNSRFLLRNLSTSFYYPFYDQESEKLYFSANFEDGYGGTDIYYVYTNGGMIMSAPVNLGPRINTPGNEIAPFVYDSSLYFSSDVFYGLGGMDIYKTEIQGEDQYSIPVNLGHQINSPHDEFGFIIRENPQGEGLQGYFSSNRPGGMGSDDIYGFIVNEKPGLKTLVFEGSIVESGNSRGIDKAYFRIFDQNDSLLRETYSEENGEFRIEIPWREKVKIKAGKERHSKITQNYSNDDQQTTSGKLGMRLELQSVERISRNHDGQRIVRANDFYFDRNSANITEAIAEILNKVAADLKPFSGLEIRLEAHTDSRGNRNTNQQLSARRARAIRSYLISQGVPSSVFKEVVGMGEEQIRNNCKDGVYCLDFLHRQNERYSLIILNYQDWE